MASPQGTRVSQAAVATACSRSASCRASAFSRSSASAFAFAAASSAAAAAAASAALPPFPAFPLGLPPFFSLGSPASAPESSAVVAEASACYDKAEL